MVQYVFVRNEPNLPQYIRQGLCGVPSLLGPAHVHSDMYLSLLPRLVGHYADGL